MERPAEQPISYREALREALRETLHAHPDAFLLGEDVGHYGGAFGVSRGLLEEFGPERIMDMPLSEAGFTGMAIGAAMAGLKPIVEIMTVNFSLLALDQLFNQAATLGHMTAGQVAVPMVVRISCGAGRQLAAQHSHSWEVFFAHVPGLKVISVGTIDDARFTLARAITEPGPVVILEYTSMLSNEGIIAADGHPLGTARVIKPGKDITLISFGTGVAKVTEAAALLLAEGVDAEVIDLRILRPMDTETIYNSVRRTHRALIAEDGWQSYGIGAEVAARIGRDCFYDLDAPVTRLGGREIPVPYPAHLEKACFTDGKSIADAALNLCGHD